MCIQYDVIVYDHYDVDKDHVITALHCSGPSGQTPTLARPALGLNFFLAKVAKGFTKALAKFSKLCKLSKFDCQEPAIIIFSLANLAKSSRKVLAKSNKS